MQSNLSRWGNSIGLRIPKDMASRLRLVEGTRVEIETDGDRLIVKRADQYSLADLLQGMTPEAMHTAFDWGDDQGREIVD